MQMLKTWLLVTVLVSSVEADPVPVHVQPDVASTGVRVDVDEDAVRVVWPIDRSRERRAELTLSRRPGRPLIRRLSVGKNRGPAAPVPVVEDIQPVWFLTVGSRRVPPGKPAWQKWMVFFDNPASRPHKVYTMQPELDRIVVAGDRGAVRVRCGTLRAGEFSGFAEISFYPGCDLVHLAAVVRTEEDRRAITYDAGLVDVGNHWQSVGWIDLNDRLVTRPVSAFEEASPLKVRYRTVAADTGQGAVACFPPPHQFQFPRDWSDNLGFVWAGTGYRSLPGRGIGIRQPPTGGGNWVPWFNAPPGRDHRLSLFLVALPTDLEGALRRVRDYTHDDRFVPLEGYKTFTSHYHMAVAVTAMERERKGLPPLNPPDFVNVFRRMGVNMVHLAEFHGDGHQKDPGPLRLPELQWMFRECRRLSGEDFLLIPGEEVNTFLGLPAPGRHPGHWMSLFPKPVYWIMQRKPDQPFVETIPPYGRVYRVGSREDMVRLLEAENGLVWAAHPRIKASSWTPDVFRNESFFLADFWLGGAWKAMPGDLSDDRLGRRVLDLLDDMSNWGVKKYVLGEVDVFKIDRTHELYSHMNINYLRLDDVPRFDGGWQPVLEALRKGQFFVSTGEVLIPRFTVAGQPSGSTVSLSGNGTVPVEFELRWTFPLNIIELISGDGERVYRQRIPLPDRAGFGERSFRVEVDLTGKRWVRLEAWDVAVNGAFTQPVWIEEQ